MAWIIAHKDNRHLCWNDTSQSWESENYDTFDADERATMELPPNGEWERVPWEKLKD